MEDSGSIRGLYRRLRQALQSVALKPAGVDQLLLESSANNVLKRSQISEKLTGSQGRGLCNISASQWKVLLVLTAINLLNYFDRLLVVPMFPTLKAQFHISDFQLGLLASVVLLVDCLTALPAGYWSDRGPRQKIMAAGVFVWGAATFASGFAPTFGALLGARGAVGVGEGAYAPGGTAIISASFPARLRARVQSIFSLGAVLGGVLGLAAGGVLAQWIGWRHSFMLVGPPGVLIGVAIRRLPGPSSKPPEETHPAWGLLKIAAYDAVLAGGMLVAFSSAVFISWSPTFIARYHHLSVGKASGLLALLVLVSSAFGVLAGGYLADRIQEHWAWGRAFVVGTAILLATPFLYVAVQANALSVFYVCIFVATGSLACYLGPTTAIIHDLTPTQAHAFAFGLYMFIIHFFGDAMAPALVGFVSDISSLRRGLLLGVAANFVSGVCFLAAVWLIRRPPHSCSS
jgi:MFS transporter, Spinster family, sphingosine-1-phosphate transporter